MVWLNAEVVVEGQQRKNTMNNEQLVECFYNNVISEKMLIAMYLLIRLRKEYDINFHGIIIMQILIISLPKKNNQKDQNKSAERNF